MAIPKSPVTLAPSLTSSTRVPSDPVVPLFRVALPMAIPPWPPEPVTPSVPTLASVPATIEPSVYASEREPKAIALSPYAFVVYPIAVA